SRRRHTRSTRDWSSDVCSSDLDGFVWKPAPAPAALAEHLASFGVRLEEGQSGEVSPDAARLHRRLSRALARGSLVAFDYGHNARSEERRVGKEWGRRRSPCRNT